MDSSKQHWDKIYSTWQPNEVSWTQDNPTISLDFIRSFRLDRHASIIDIGGGESKLVDHLLELGYENITVLDISKTALEKTQKRLGAKSSRVNWIEADVTEFESDYHFDIWHDRATFHFLTTADLIDKYIDRTRKYIKINGYFVVGTFSEHGPDRCSGLSTKQYSVQSLESQLSNGFSKITCVSEDHRTPSGTLQNFLFCSFRRMLGT
jgi:2-polyprenyl-3-methyl-5-hydroxy-6-metoxy-1,4-benzoquinol methylase